MDIYYFNVPCNFYPRPPRGGRLRMLLNSALISLFLSTPSARRATGEIRRKDRPVRISIHALREEGDLWWSAASYLLSISIHALREEGDTLPSTARVRSSRFLSTPSARRATAETRPDHRPAGNFYPRPPRGGRLHCRSSSKQAL